MGVKKTEYNPEPVKIISHKNKPSIKSKRGSTKKVLKQKKKELYLLKDKEFFNKNIDKIRSGYTVKRGHDGGLELEKPEKFDFKRSMVNYWTGDYQKDAFNFWVKEVEGAGKTIKHTVGGLGKLAYDVSAINVVQKSYYELKQYKDTLRAFGPEKGKEIYIKRKKEEAKEGLERAKNFLKVVLRPKESIKAVYRTVREDVKKQIEPFKKGDIAGSGEAFGSFLTEIALFAAPFSKSAKAITFEKRMREFSKLSAKISEPERQFLEETMKHTKDLKSLAMQEGSSVSRYHDVAEVTPLRDIMRFRGEIGADLRDLQKFEKLLQDKGLNLERAGKGPQELCREFYRAFEEVGASGNKYRLWNLWREEIKSVPPWLDDLIKEGRSTGWVDVGKLNPQVLKGLARQGPPDPIALRLHNLSRHHLRWKAGMADSESALDIIGAWMSPRIYKPAFSKEKMFKLIEEGLAFPPEDPYYFNSKQAELLRKIITDLEQKGIVK